MKLKFISKSNAIGNSRRNCPLQTFRSLIGVKNERGLFLLVIHMPAGIFYSHVIGSFSAVWLGFATEKVQSYVEKLILKIYFWLLNSFKLLW